MLTTIKQCTSHSSLTHFSTVYVSGAISVMRYQYQSTCKLHFQSIMVTCLTGGGRSSSSEEEELLSSAGTAAAGSSLKLLNRLSAGTVKPGFFCCSAVFFAAESVWRRGVNCSCPVAGGGGG